MLTPLKTHLKNKTTNPKMKTRIIDLPLTNPGEEAIMDNAAVTVVAVAVVAKAAVAAKAEAQVAAVNVVDEVVAEAPTEAIPVINMVNVPLRLKSKLNERNITKFPNLYTGFWGFGVLGFWGFG